MDNDECKYIECPHHYVCCQEAASSIFVAEHAKYMNEQELDPTENIAVHRKQWKELLTLIESGEFKHRGGLAAILRYQLKLG